jgi:hypothetical protein
VNPLQDLASRLRTSFLRPTVAATIQSDDYAPDDYAPDDYAPDDYAPDDYAPDDYAPDDYAPDDYAPRETGESRSTPAARQRNRGGDRAINAGTLLGHLHAKDKTLPETEQVSFSRLKAYLPNGECIDRLQTLP